MRVSDNERQQAADRLSRAQAEGRITVSEYDDRLGRLYQALTYGDIDDLFVDIPNPMPVQPLPPMPPMPPPTMAGTITGPAAIVHNNIVIPGPMYLPPNSGYATAGLVFGILGLVGFWIPFGDVVLSLAAVLLSGIGLSQTSGGRMTGHGRAVAGLVCGIVGLVPAVIVISLILTAAAAIH
jgi:hypothetical protein